MSPTRSPTPTVNEAPASEPRVEVAKTFSTTSRSRKPRPRRAGEAAALGDATVGDGCDDVADHRGDELVVAERRRRRREDELAVADDRDVLADLEDLLEVVGDVQHRDTAVDEGPHAVEEPAYAVALERRRRLVQQQAARPPRERARDLDDLALLDRQRRARLVRVDVEVPFAQDAAGLRAHRSPVDDAAALRAGGRGRCSRRR